jgi:hypothetical protein
MGSAWITGCELPPGPLLGVVLFPFKDVHVVTQEDERVRAGARAEDMAVIVDVAGRGQCATSPRVMALSSARRSSARPPSWRTASHR